MESVEYWEVKQYFKEDCEEWVKDAYNYNPDQIVDRSIYEWGVRKHEYKEKIFIYSVLGGVYVA